MFVFRINIKSILKEEMSGTFNIGFINARFIETINKIIIEIKTRSRVWLNPRRSLVKSFRPHVLWTLCTLYGPRRINVKIICLKALTEGASRKEWPKLFHSINVEGKKVFLKN